MILFKLLLLITGAVQTLPSLHPHIATMHGLMTGRASGSRHVPLEEVGERQEMRRKWEESSSRATGREKNGRRNKRSEVDHIAPYMKNMLKIFHATI